MPSILEELQLLKQAAQEQTGASNDLVLAVIAKLSEIDGKVESIVTEVNAQLDNPLEVIFYLSSSGSDLNTGASSNTPILTVKEAVDRTPTGGLCKLFVADSEVYLLSERTLVSDCDLEIKLGVNSVFEQSLTPDQSVSGLLMGMRQAVVLSGGEVRTAVDGSPPSMDKALFSRQDRAKIDLRVFGSKVALGDQNLGWGGQTANGMHDFSLGHSSVEFRAGKTQSSKLFSASNGCFSLALTTVTNNTGSTFVDLVGGVYRVNNLPINMVTNSSAVYGG